MEEHVAIAKFVPLNLTPLGWLCFLLIKKRVKGHKVPEREAD